MLSQTCEYALRAAVCMASDPDRWASTPHLAARAGIPSTYLAKVLQALAAAGIVSGRRGVGGGYRLARSPASISLAEVAEVFGPIAPLQAPIRAHSSGERAQDPALRDLYDALAGIAASIQVRLQQTSLAALANARETPPLEIHVNPAPNIVADQRDRRDDHALPANAST